MLHIFMNLNGDAYINHLDMQIDGKSLLVTDSSEISDLDFNG